MTCKEKVEKYLARIGINVVPAPTLENLAMLQKAHLTHVPYEDIDIWRGKAGTLAYDELFDKIVNRGRGGYCFELNGLFGWLLKELGYNTVEHFGRWLMGEALEVPGRRHRVIRVKLDGADYIADVGVGQRAPFAPLELVHDKVQNRECVDYRIVAHERLGHVVEVLKDGVWMRFYSFDDAAQEPIDFNYVHYYCVNHPRSFFRSNLLVHIPTNDGRHSIGFAPDPETGELQPLLSVSDKNGTRQKYLRTPTEFAVSLKEYFGIVEY